jgi:hypothetical protein
MDPGQTDAVAMPMPVLAPRFDWLMRYAFWFLPTCSTVPFESSAGAVDPRSWSALFMACQLLGAKYWVRARPGDNCRTESLKSYVDDVDPFPVATQMFPAPSTSGAAPPIHTAPSLPIGTAW